MHNQQELEHIKSARSKFIAMASTYCLGVFNDNYFKQAALLLAVTSGMSHLQGTATVLFALPFILCSSYAGWVADRFAKRNVVISSKALECVAMLIGAAGIIFSNWPCILAMVFLMGLQSTFFSPALNGSIPELYPESYVAKANGLLKLVTTLAILAGIATAGMTLDAEWPSELGLPSGTSLVAIFVVLVAFIGFFASFGVHSKPAPKVKKPFPKYGPISSLHDVWVICKDRQLLLAIFSDTYFYFVASIAVLTINTLGLKQLGFSQTITSLLSVFLMLGICTGSLFVARIIDMKKWGRFLVSASLGMAVGLFLAALTVFLPESIQAVWLIGSLIFVGFAGGVFLIPITSFLQVHPDRADKGQVLATTNFCGFVGIMCSGFVFTTLDSFMSPASMMATIGIMSVITTFIIIFLKNNKQNGLVGIVARLIRAALSLRYKVEIKGLEHIEKDDSRGTLFLPNHPALLDPVLVMSTLYSKFNPRPLSDVSQANKPLIRYLMRVINPITIPDFSNDGRGSHAKIKEAMQEVADSLNRSDDILFYPAGRLYRSKHEDLAGNSGVQFLLDNAPDAKIVLVRTSGLWGSSFSRANGAPGFGKQIVPIIKFMLCNFFLFGPRRKLTIEFIEDTSITSLKTRSKINRYLENIYNQTASQNTTIPYYWWQGRTSVIIPENEKTRIKGSIADIPQTTIEHVTEKIEELTGLKVEHQHRLANDLAMDSLIIMELATWLESEYGNPIEDIATLDTVEDCILAASGKLLDAGNSEIQKISEKWFSSSTAPLVMPTGEKITTLFLNQALAHPNKVILADQISGCKTYRDLLTAIFLLKPLIENIPGDRIGIMLPASVSSTIIYLTVLFSGKTPVMYNWTVGRSNLAHGIDQTKTTHIISANALYKRIAEQGTDLDSLETDWIFLEDVAASMSLPQKMSALAKATFSAKTLEKSTVAETAAILFTSGSESMPKAVPLSHGNIIANLQDFSTMLSFCEDDSLLGMLPPFHSLGLTGTVILPVCLGLKTSYHPNPTESVTLAKLVGSFKTTTLIGTPTFINGILQVGNEEQLKSIRLVFTGAEKCPESVYTKLTEVNQKVTLCEGYGITECSPLVSLNTVDDNNPGTIGKVVPSIEYVIIDLESNQRVKRGDRGILLLRGPSIFDGYLNDTTDKGFHQYDSRRWYQTGDFVRENENGVLVFSGRKKRFIKLGGEMISLPAIESALLKHFPNTSDGSPALAIEATSSLEHPEVVLFTTVSLLREEVNGVIRNAGLSPLYNIRKIVSIDEIPVLGTGKTDYKLLKELLNAKN